MMTICQAVCLSVLRSGQQNAHQVHRLTDGAFAIETCRQSLKRLQRGNLVDAESVKHPVGKCGASSVQYKITERGREELQDWIDQIAPLLELSE